MSTVDPVVERRRRENEHRPGAGGALTRLTLRGGLWFLFGFGAADLMNYPASSVYLTRDTYPPNEIPGLGFALVFVTFSLGIIGGVIGSRPTRFANGVGIRIAAGFVGAALGVFYGARRYWVPAPRVGWFVDAAGRTRGPWGPVAWIDWSSQYWVPGALVILAIVCRLFGIRIDRRRRVRAARVKAVLATGVRVGGVVTAVEDTGLEIRDEPRLRIIVKFTDHLEVDRWVTKKALFDRFQLPRVGDPAVVWFDPLHPGDEDAIPVALGTLEEIGDGPPTGVRLL